jgi:hypothetical protein
MNINVEAVYIVSAMIFVTSMGGLGAAWLMLRRDDRLFREEMERRRADRS